MLQKQQTGSEVEQQLPPCQQLIQQILRLKHHSSMINYRYEQTYDKYYTNVDPNSNFNDHDHGRKISQDHRRVWDILAYANDHEYVQSFYYMGLIVANIRHAVLNRVANYPIAPVFNSIHLHGHALTKIYRRYCQGLANVRDSNTMHTQSSTKNQKSKKAKIQNIIGINYNPDKTNKIPNSTDPIENLNPNIFLNDQLSKQGKSQSQTVKKLVKKIKDRETHDTSRETLNKITQDLGRMIHHVYVTKKIKDFQFKINKNLPIRPIANNNNNNKNKQAKLKSKSKKKFFQVNVSAIKNRYEDNGYDEPDENYGLKRYKRNNSKNMVTNKQQKSKQKIKWYLSETKKSRKQSSQYKQKQQQKTHYSPLTPKPISISKMRMGWGDNLNKKSRRSSKSKSFIEQTKKSRKLLKSPTANPNPNINTNKITSTSSAKQFPKSPTTPTPTSNSNSNPSNPPNIKLASYYNSVRSPTKINIRPH